MAPYIPCEERSSVVQAVVTQKRPPMEILLAAPRGFCAGVVRAIQIVELAIEKYGTPVYVRHEIVHNRRVVETLERKGAIFVDEIDEVEAGRPVIFSAHGVPKSVPKDASNRNLFWLDATCPLVSKVHVEAERLHAQGYEIVLIGHAGHPEIIGTIGQLPAGAIHLIETVEDVAEFAPKTGKLAYVTQTTLSVDDTAAIVEALNARFPAIVGPHKEDICYATTNRQEAVKRLAAETDIILVIGAPNSSNAVRLVEVASRSGAKLARLVQRAERHRLGRLEGRGANRHHIRRLGAGDSGRGSDRCLCRALRGRYPRDRDHPRDRAVQAPARTGDLKGARLAVYTLVEEEALAKFLSDYEIGSAHSFKGIAEGVENSNYILDTEGGRFILTLYERRVKAADLPFFLGLMEHLAARGVPCPVPFKRKDGKVVSMLAGRPAALISFLEGLSVARPTVEHCRQVGAALGDLHRLGTDYQGRRENAMGLTGWRTLAGEIGARADTVSPGLARVIAAELDYLGERWPTRLPQGIIHADLFPDNVFFLKDRLSGLIDFYFACSDILAFDLVICLNAWCFERTGEFNVTKARALVSGYRARRAPIGRRDDRLARACARRGLAFSPDTDYRLDRAGAGRARSPQGPGRISAKAAIPSAHRPCRGIRPWLTGRTLMFPPPAGRG